MDSKQAINDRIQRMKWWNEARFGMFIHWGLYSQTGRHEWVMNRERIPVAEYEKLAATWNPKPRAARDWAALAKKAGMGYMVMTTKHHEGFCLWDSKVTDYCAGKRGPRRDLVQEYVDACREFGLKIGFYYSLMDWHHPDGHACARDEKARRRFIDYTYGLVNELMTRYEKIDILWYDVSWPLTSPEKWESKRINAMARKLQPHILINDRSQLPEDFGTPEEHIVAGSSVNGRGWEACMTFNGAWGWMDTPDEDWLGARKVLAMLNQCAAGGGNLLLNVGPKPDGSVPAQAVERLSRVGQWLKTYGEAVYGTTARLQMEWMPVSSPANFWTGKDTTYYCWVARWPGRELAIGGLRGTVKKVGLVGGADSLPFEQGPDRLVIKGLPEKCPDDTLSVAVLRFEFEGIPMQQLGCGCEPVAAPVAEKPEQGKSEYIAQWKFTFPVKKPAAIAKAPYVGLAKTNTLWTPINARPDGFVCIHDRFQDVDGLVYLGATVTASKAGTWQILLGHDGPARLFVDGKAVACAKGTENPAKPDRTQATVKLGKGSHEVVVAFDMAKGSGWGIFLRFGATESGIPVFPKQTMKASR